MLAPSNSPEIPFPLHLPTGADRAEAEFGSIDLGDSRCSRRLAASFASRLASPGKSIPQCTGSIAAARAFYRLTDPELLTDTLIFDPHRAGGLRRAQASGVEVFPAIQDTTTFNLNSAVELEQMDTKVPNSVTYFDKPPPVGSPSG